ncbi:hypothetical protein ACFX5U_04155 [Sphingobacterium sp. SG20118]|uniref:hypothetical protein n=1 Tax=Sphingobacterium sp. SG20118 TaxID=3367156 RepID=UPI0037DFC077
MVKILVKYIPIRRWDGAPGVSDNPSNNAPKDTNVSIHELPHGSEYNHGHNAADSNPDTIGEILAIKKTFYFLCLLHNVEYKQIYKIE